MSTFTFSKDNLPKQLVINNEYVDSKSSKKLSVYNPKNGELVADDVPLAGEQDVDEAVAAAEKAFPAWKATLPSQRRNMLNKFADLIEKHGKEIGELTRITLGAPWGSFGAFEINLCAETLRYASPGGRSYDWHCSPRSQVQRRLDRQVCRRVVSPGRWLSQDRTQRAARRSSRHHPLERSNR